MPDRRAVPRSLAHPEQPANLRFGAKVAVGLAILCLVGPVAILLLWLGLAGGEGAIVDLPVLAIVFVVLEAVAFPIGGVVAVVLAIVAIVKGEDAVPRLGWIALGILAVAVVLVLVQLAFWE